MPVHNLLNTSASVERSQIVPDGMGGSVETWVSAGAFPAKVDQATASERQLAAQWGSKHSHNVYFDPATDVQRGDRLTSGGHVFRVLATVQPSRPVYLRAECEFIETEDGA